MKNITKILIIGLTAGAFASCADDLDTKYYGSNVTTEDKEEVLQKNPERAQAAVTGAFANFNLCENVYDNHFDFGYPAIMLGLDLQTEDLVCKWSGYNWHQDWEGYTAPNMNGVPTNMAWYTMYNQIFTANALIATIAEDTDVPELQFYLGNGLALRAYDYFILAQLYAHNYATHKDDKCVPIITNLNSEECAANGAPRATVEEVYAQILSDINKAVDLISASGIAPQQVISSKPKRLISLAAVYGLRARIKLVMHDYSGAAADAQAAINSFSGRPYSRDELMTPGFTNLDDASWMWGIAVAETDRVVTTGIVNFPSFISSFAYGYTTYGAWKYCGYGLYQQISPSDVRKGWFLDDNYKSDHLNAQWQAFIDNYIGTPVYDAQDNTNCVMPQTNVKYGTYNNVLENPINAADIPLMRIEEMYLTYAEAIGMSGDLGGGKAALESFVKTYRDPKYTCTAASADEFQDACWVQRRIELWGEGQSWFDVMRLNKGIDRVGDRFPTVMTYRINPGDNVLIYVVPEAEITANRQISTDEIEKLNSDRPTPVTE